MFHSKCKRELDKELVNRVKAIDHLRHELMALTHEIQEPQFLILGQYMRPTYGRSPVARLKQLEQNIDAIIAHLGICITTEPAVPAKLVVKRKCKGEKK